MNNIDIVKNFIEIVLNQEKFDELDKYVSAHFQTHSLHINPKPIILDNLPKTFKEALIQSQKALSNFQRKIEDIFSDGDKVVVRWTSEADHIGNFMGIPATNKHITFSGMSIYRIENDKIVDEWYIWDRQGLNEQIKV